MDVDAGDDVFGVPNTRRITSRRAHARTHALPLGMHDLVVVVVVVVVDDE
jgi:hypothetical protein